MRFVAVVLVGVLAACGSESAEPPRRTTPTPLDVTKPWFGRSYAEWIDAQYQWYWGSPLPDPKSCRTPQSDPDGSLCAVGQDPASPVFFLQAFRTRTYCTVPAGKAILVTLHTGWMSDFGRPVRTEAEIRTEVVKLMDNLLATLPRMRMQLDDLAPIEYAMRDYLVGPVPLTLVVPPPPNAFSCVGRDGVSGSFAPAYAASTAILLEPLPAGDHVLRFVDLSSSPIEAWFTLHVEPTSR
jgi:hypothetical protein